MNLLDLVIVVLAVLAAWNGYRRGASLQISTYVGLFLGLIVGAFLAPKVAGLVHSPLAQAAVALLVLLACAAAGDALGWLVGSRIWALARRTPLGGVDSALGTAMSVAVVLLAVWFVGVNLVNGPFPTVSKEVQGSAVIRAMDEVLPQPPSVIARIEGLLNRFGFPQVFAGLPPAPAGPVREPSDRQIRRAVDIGAPSTLKIVGRACDAIQEGSGFLAAEHYVITNAHVVAGVQFPEVQQQNDGSEPATVVLFDPDTDVAVLYVENTPEPVLRLDPKDERRGTPGAVLGYPGGGSLTARPAAIRREIDAVGRDIYGRSVVQRDVYELQAEIRPGNSGGPLLELDGDVAGVVFAASTTDPDVGYALTSSEVIPELRKAEGRTTAVSTGACTR